MANTNAPFGFTQYRGNGSAPTYEQVVATILSTDTTPIFCNDPVAPTAAGYVTQASSNSVQVSGIFVGCKYLSTSQKRTVWSRYWPGSDNSGDVEAYVINDPNARWLVQSDATGVTQAGINANIGFAIGTGSTATGTSGAYLDTSTINTTSTLPFRIIALGANPPGSPGTEAGAYNRVVVAFNNVSTKQLTGV